MECAADHHEVVQLRLPVTYHSLTVPARLLTDLSDSPLAIGLYGLVARLFLIEHTPIPLSTGDVQRYDPTLSRSAIVRAFNRLVRGGWIIEETKPGCKTIYTPAWGFVSGSPRAWRIGATLLDRPRRTQVVLLNKRLLDTCIGKLIPHGTNPATIERYLTHPLLSVSDVGTYLLLDNGGRPQTTLRLQSLGLVRDNRTAPLASDGYLLALASQRALPNTDQPTELTKKGLLKLGCLPVDEVEDVIVREQPLFFVSPGMFGSMTTNMDSNMTGSTSQKNSQDSRLEKAQIPHADADASITWMKGNQGNKGITTPLPPSEKSGGGGQIQAVKGMMVYSQPSPQNTPTCEEIHQEQAIGAEQAITVESETVQLLQSLNICPTVIAELADQPLERVQAAITDGKARPGVRDLGGWVVSLVRLGRDHNWKIQPPSPRAGSPEDLREAFTRYAAQQEAEPKTNLTSEYPEMLVTPAAFKPEDILVRIWNNVQEALRTQTSRQEFDTWLRCARLQTVRDGVAVIAVPDVRVKDGIERRFLSVLRDRLTAYIGEPIMVRIIIDGVSHGVVEGGTYTDKVLLSSTMDVMSTVPSKEVSGCPGWISAERWQTLPGMLRVVLRSARLEGGQVIGASPHMTHLLQTRYANQVAALIDTVGMDEALPSSDDTSEVAWPGRLVAECFP